MAQFKKFNENATSYDDMWIDCTPEEDAAVIAAIIETTPTA